MSKVQEFLNGETGVFLDALTDERIVFQASKQFVDRGYLTTYKPYYMASKRGLWVLQGASILFALSYVASLLLNLLPSFMPFWSVIALSFGGLYFVEVGKKLTLTRSIDSILKRYADSFFYVLAAVFLAVSIYTSVSGLMQFSKQQTDKSTSINAGYSVQKDSIEKYYTALIKAERTALSEYKRQVSYKGKIDMTNPTNRKTILGYENRITDMNTQKQNALNETRNDNSLILNENRSKTKIVTSEMFIVALINEILIIVCLWFNRDYLSKVFLSQNESLNVSNDAPRTIQGKIFAVKRNCVHCGESYEIGHKKQKFCSNLCRMDYHNAKRQRESTA
jgi:hypothetical protein